MCSRRCAGSACALRSTCVDSTVGAAHEDDTPGVASHAASLVKVVKKLHQVLDQRCGLAAHEARTRSEAELGAALAELVSACEKQGSGAAVSVS